MKTGITKKSSVFGLVLFAMLFALSLAAQAQQSGKFYRIGYISNAPGQREGTEKVFAQALRELGYEDGKNTIIEWRFFEGKS